MRATRDPLPLGAAVVVYGGPGPHGYSTGVIVREVHLSPVEALFGDGGSLGVYTVRDDATGAESDWSPLIVASADDFRRAWHLLDAAGRIVAGGPGMRDNGPDSVAALIPHIAWGAGAPYRVVTGVDLLAIPATQGA